MIFDRAAVINSALDAVVNRIAIDGVSIGSEWHPNDESVRLDIRGHAEVMTRTRSTRRVIGDAIAGTVWLW